MTQKTHYKPIGAATHGLPASDADIARAIDDAGVPVTSYPKGRPERAAGEGARLRKAGSGKDDGDGGKRALMSERSRHLSLELPDYVLKELKRLAYEQECSVRFLILEALEQRFGITVRPEDKVVDGRRRRGEG